MPTIFDSAARQQLLTRLDRLAPTATPRWGRMTAPQMVSHLIESYRFGAGELTLPLWVVPFRPIVRWVALYVLPFPKAAPAAPQLLARAPDAWATDVAALRERIARFAPPPVGTSRPPHPIFGVMRDADLGVLAYKHTDHHFRQFGV
ncbi:MAG: hypothetical protein P3A31_06745 [Gemmatimonadota bacterium]|nr:hypothetical protein [Gemmatimonadota bacterium]MDQ8157097.1 hypothetical protein [Gemmatimonadota bacterium]